MLRHTRIVCEYIAAGIGLAVLLSALLIWRLDAAPFSSSILTPYFEKVAEYVLPGIDAEIGQTLSHGTMFRTLLRCKPMTWC